MYKYNPRSTTPTSITLLLRQYIHLNTDTILSKMRLKLKIKIKIWEEQSIKIVDNLYKGSPDIKEYILYHKKINARSYIPIEKDN